MFHNDPPTVYVFRGSPRFGLQILLLGYILLCVKYGVACVCAQAVPLRIDRATLTVAASPLGIKPEASVLYVSPVSVTELPAPTMMAARLISVYPSPRTPGSRSRIPWSLPPPDIRGRVRRPTRLRSGSPGSPLPEFCPGFWQGATGRQGQGAGRPGHSRRGSRCLHRCGCRPPPATHGRGHTATIFAACCRRSRFVASAVRFLMDATAGVGRSGHAPGSSRIRMCAKFITTLRRRTHQGADSPAISALRASSALSRGRAPVRYSNASFYSRSSAASDGVCSNARISRVLCQSFRWCRSDRYAQSN